jgi:hypothetical protein
MVIEFAIFQFLSSPIETHEHCNDHCQRNRDLGHFRGQRPLLANGEVGRYGRDRGAKQTLNWGRSSGSSGEGFLKRAVA